MINKKFQIYHCDYRYGLGEWKKKQSDKLLSCTDYENDYMWHYADIWNYFTTYKELEKYIND